MSFCPGVQRGSGAERKVIISFSLYPFGHMDIYIKRFIFFKLNQGVS